MGANIAHRSEKTRPDFVNALRIYYTAILAENLEYENGTTVMTGKRREQNRQ